MYVVDSDIPVHEDASSLRHAALRGALSSHRAGVNVAAVQSLRRHATQSSGDLCRA